MSPGRRHGTVEKLGSELQENPVALVPSAGEECGAGISILSASDTGAMKKFVVETAGDALTCGSGILKERAVCHRPTTSNAGNRTPPGLRSISVVRESS